MSVVSSNCRANCQKRWLILAEYQDYTLALQELADCIDSLRSSQPSSGGTEQRFPPLIIDGLSAECDRHVRESLLLLALL